MTTYNDVMTVTQLTDLVAFLQAHYEDVRHPRYKYTRYDLDEKEAPESE